MVSLAIRTAVPTTCFTVYELSRATSTPFAAKVSNANAEFISSLDNDVKRSLHKGMEFRFERVVDGWGFTTYDGMEGWISVNDFEP